MSAIIIIIFIAVCYLQDRSKEKGKPHKHEVRKDTRSSLLKEQPFSFIKNHSKEGI